MKELFFATNNHGKLEEVRRVAGKSGIDIYSPNDLGITLDPDEIGSTYYENALLKAEAFRAIVPRELLVVGDDSGVEIPSINNEPGIFSRRWRDHETEMTDAEIIEYCLERTRGKKHADRLARFVVVLVGIEGSGKKYTATGELNGRILEEPVADAPTLEGFPFRSIFQEISTGKMLYELEDGEVITHRQKAFQNLFDQFA